MMDKRRRGRGSKYTDDFKRKVVAESSADGVSVPFCYSNIGCNRNCAYDPQRLAWPKKDPCIQVVRDPLDILKELDLTPAVLCTPEP